MSNPYATVTASPMMIQQPPSVTASPGMMYPQSAMSNPYTTVTASPVMIQQQPSVIASTGMRYQQQPMMIQQQPMMIMQPVMALQPSVVTVPYPPPRQEIIMVERPREVMTYVERPSVTSEYSNVKYGGRYAYKEEDRDRVITPQYRSRSPTRTPVTDSKPSAGWDHSVIDRSGAAPAQPQYSGRRDYSGDAVYSSLTRPSSPSPMTYRMAIHSAAPTHYAPSYSAAPKRMVSYGDTGGYTTYTRPAQTSGSTRVVYDSGPRSYGGGIYDFGYGPRSSAERRW